MCWQSSVFKRKCRRHWAGSELSLHGVRAFRLGAGLYFGSCCGYQPSLTAEIKPYPVVSIPSSFSRFFHRIMSFSSWVMLSRLCSQPVGDGSHPTKG